MDQPNDSRYHRSNQSSPALVMTNGIQQYPNNYSYHYSPITPSPSSSSVQCSAYFISRVDLSNYTIQTLKQTIDSVVSGPKSKGLKVKLSLPDDGLIINNVPDPSQSWMYRASELLYFWRDPYYVNIIVVITFNRTNYHRTRGPYSATIFRLRGNESVQLFLQRAQQFFAQLSSRNTPKSIFEKSATTEHMTANNNHKDHRKRSKHHSKSKNKSMVKSSLSSQTTPVPHVTHTEFDPKQITTTDSIFNLYNRRTYSDTTISSTSNSKQLDDDEKMTTVSNYLPSEYVTELVRELKELRSEIAALKLETRVTPVRSTSTSPLVFNETDSKEIRSSSQSEIDAETQTDFSLMNNGIKMDVSNEISISNKRKNEQSNTKINKQTYLNSANNIGSNREESTLVNSSSNNGVSSFYAQEGYQPTSYPSRPRPMIINYQNGTTISTPKGMEKDSSSIPMNTESSSLLRTGEVVSFRSSLDDTIAPPENIYENIPIFIPINSNQTSSTNEHDQQKDKPYLYVTIANDQNSELQQQYLSQLFGPQNGISLLVPPESLQKKTNSSSSSTTPPETISYNQNYFQQVLFSNHLTNPLFNVDKQLLANTIANQFGIDVNSPNLQKLMANQHLFVNNKRTFANMIWQITPEEENALLSSPGTSNSTIPDINTSDSNNTTAKPILKPKASSHLASKGQRISWDSTLD